MNKNEFIEGLKKIVKPYVQNEEAFEQLTEETDFIGDLKINSANLVDIVLDVEDEFDNFIFSNGGDQTEHTIVEGDMCRKLGIKMVFGLGDKIQSSSWLLKK